MRLLTQPPRRGGFTLIELLVVVSILAILAALTMAGISRVRSGQHAATTEGTLKKCQVAVNQQVTAGTDEATKEGNVYAALLQSALCDGDKDRAKSLTAYAMSKRNFPTKFVEAKAAIAGIPPHSAFATIPLGSGLSPAEESAALLYIIVHDMSGRGTAIDSDNAFSGAEIVIKDPTPMTGKEYKAYKDGHGTPIALVRWYGGYYAAFPNDPRCQELQSPPFTNTKDSIFDPFDRWAKLKNAWPTPANRVTALSALNANAALPLKNSAGTNDFDGKNRVITVVSAGPDKKFGPIFGGSVQDANDDVYGYPLARIGAKGD